MSYYSYNEDPQCLVPTYLLVLLVISILYAYST